MFGYLGYMYRKVRETELAIKAYEDQIKVRPHAAYYTNLGFIYWERRDYGNALEILNRHLQSHRRGQTGIYRENRGHPLQNPCAALLEQDYGRVSDSDGCDL